MSHEEAPYEYASGRTPPTVVTRPPMVSLTPDNIERLKRYPRPPHDNGRGLHFHLDLRPSIVAETVEHLKSIGATWTLIYAPDAEQAKYTAKACWDAGIMPVVRIGKLIDEGFDPVPYVRALEEVGAPPYIQIYNEPNDSREWKDDTPDNWVQIFARNWARVAAQVFDAGGYPGLQVLDKPELDAVVDAVRYNNREDIWERTFFVQHNYGSNHPPDYPYDAINQQEHPGATILDDPLSILSFLAYAVWMQEKLGFVLPIMGGEGGWPYEREEDRRYPKVGQPYHADFHRETFDWFRIGVISNGEPLPDYLFSIVPWLAGSWDFPSDNWWGSLSGDRVETIAALASIPPFERRFSWDEDEGPDVVIPPEKPEPIEPEKPEPEPIEPDKPKPEPIEPDKPEAPPLAWDERLDDLGVRLERSGESPAWRLVTAEYWDPSQAGDKQHIEFAALDETGEPAAGVRFVADWEGRRDDENPAYAVTNARGEADAPIWIPLDPEKQDGIIFATTADAPGDVVRGMGRPNYGNVIFKLTYRWGARL